MLSARSRLLVLSTALLLTACDRIQSQDDPELTRADIKKLSKMLPKRVKDRQAWAEDILKIMDELKIERNLQNTCSIVAVVDQESNFQADPAVPNLGKTAMEELNDRLEKKLGTFVAGQFTKMLQERPTPDDNFAARLSKIHTEQELDQLYREMFEYFKDHYNLGIVTGAASLLSGHDMAEYFNPVKTLGSMQVHIQHAVANAKELSSTNLLRDQMYTRYGGMYYGIHRLMTYPAQYDKAIYRFADYNSGMYSSRNASIQQAVAKLLKTEMGLDGDLLLYNKDREALGKPSETELNIQRLFREHGVIISERQIRKHLLKEKQQEFEETDTYQQIQQLYKTRFEKELPYAMMPQVVISGPKLSRDYDTNWFATRVNGRYMKCRNIGKNLGLK